MSNESTSGSSSEATAETLFELPCNALWTRIEKTTGKTARFERGYFEVLNNDGKSKFINRRKETEFYFVHSGDNRPTSFRTICRSKQQFKLMVLGFVWLFIQFNLYSLEASYLLHRTLNDIDPMSPSYPGNVSRNGTDPYYHEQLDDIGFSLLPDYSYRPPWLKIGFVDLNVYIGQFLPWPLLLLSGRTKEFVDYVGILGCINILKGVVQVVTILPPARQGQACWLLNFNQEELEIVTRYPFWQWIWKSFPKYFTMGAARGCNDMLWSGHTAQTILGWLFISYALWIFQVRYFRVLRFLIAIYLVGYMIAVLLLRMHYTIDVLVGALLAYFMSTHWTLRMRIWIFSNQLVCNDDPRVDEDIEAHKLLE